MNLTNKWFRWGAWLAMCMGLSWWFFINGAFSDILTKEYIIDDQHVAPWGVLFLCVLWLYLKKSEISKYLGDKVPVIYFTEGLGLFVLSFLIPSEPEFFMLKLLVAFTGLFAVFFGRAFVLPAKLLTVFAFTILYPIVIETYLERPYALSAALPAAAASKMMGLPVIADQQTLTVGTLSGHNISVMVTGACAGPATMAVFIAIFLLMMMDVRLNDRAAAGMFLFGAAGTWTQNVLRVVVIMAAGHYGDAPSLWKAHFWTVYILFPIWYIIFAAVYFKISGKASLPPAVYSPRRA